MAKVTRLSLDGSGGLDRRRLHLREISDEADMPLDTVGQDLRKARQRKGEDLAQASQALKVRKGYLEAIEESNFEGLPGRTYTIGFVRSYADYLGLDADDCVDRLKAEIAGREDDKEGKPTLAPPTERKLPPGAVIFGFVLLVALLYGIYYLIAAASRMQSEPVAPVPARLSAEAEPQPAAPPPVVPAPETATDTAAAPPAAPIPDASAATLPPGEKFGAANTGSRITLRVHRDTRLVIQGADDRPFINRLLHPGDTYAAPNITGLKLSTPDSGAVEVILDGSSMGFIGQSGVPADDISLNPQDVVDRQEHG
jgi:cytoskeleton protein RodZ